MSLGDAPFVWGAGGARLTPDEIAQRRKEAALEIAQGTDASPLPAGTRGAGVWTQGLARVAKAITGGLDAREADAAAKANTEENRATIAALLGGGGASPSAPTDITPQATAPAIGGDPASAIAGIESGGRYDLLGPVTKTGDRAYGKYQVMGANIPEWTKAHLGQEMTPEQFLANPQAQDAVFRGQFGQYAKKYGPEGAAKAWFAGEAGMNNPNARDQLGTTVQAYADKFNRGMGGAPTAAVPVQVASNGPVAVPISPAVAKVAAAAAPVTSADDGEEDTPTSPAVAKVAAVAAPVAPAATSTITPLRSGIAAVNPAVIQAMTSPYADENTKKIAGIILQQQMTPKEVHAQEVDKAGNVWDVNRLTGQRTVALKKDASYDAPYRDADGNLVQRDNTGKISVLSAADKNPTSVNEYKFYTDTFKPSPGQPTPMPYDVWSTAKARAAATNITNNVDMNSGQTYDKQLAEGLGKSHAALANGVEDAQSRARDIAAMQGAVDAIQKAGGTTGGLAPATRLELQKSINAGLNALGIDKPFSEADLSDKEFLTKFNRSMAGAQAKNAVGSRVTNFEMSNFLKANPGLDMTIAGNQRLLGIQSQMEQRNIAVGNAIRQATAEAISQGKKIDPVTVQKIITGYDETHHIQDPITGQDLTQSYALPEFQNQGTNAALAAQHDKNMGPTEKVISGKTYVKQGDHWYEKP